MPLLDDIGAYLEAQSLGAVKTAANNPSWPIYKSGYMPGAGDQVIALSEFARGGPIDVMGATVGSVVAEEVGLQVLVRSESYVTALNKANAIWDALHKKSGTIVATRYLLIRATSSPFEIGRDQSNRHMIVAKFEVTKERG